MSKYSSLACRLLGRLWLGEPQDQNIGVHYRGYFYN